MRILHIIGTLNPESGGPAAAVTTLNKFREEHTVNEVVTLDDPGAAFLRDLDFRITALGPVGTKYGYSSKLVLWLEANRDRFDGAVVHGLWQYCGYAVRKVFRGNKPYLVFVHGMLDPYFKQTFPFKHLKKWFYWIAFEHKVLRDAYRVLFTCAEEERLACQSFSLRQWTSHIVSLGASIPEGDEGDCRVAFLSRFPQLQGRRYLLFLGRIDHKKGCDLLIAAFLKSAAIDPHLNLVLSGPDEKNWRSELQAPVLAAGLASRVHWTGMLTGDEKWGAFLCAEVFILPSHQENFGIAVTEAMACRKAVLLSDKINIAPEIVAAGAGFKESDTVEGTFKLIFAWIALSPEQRHVMELRARKLFETNYDMRTHTRDIGVLLRDAARPDLTGRPSPASATE